MNPLSDYHISTGAFNNLHGLVEATDFERHTLWHCHERVNWKDDGIGYGHQIGTLNERPIFVAFNFATIDGKRICFWHATSSLVDYDMIEEWLKTNLKYNNKVDANNFHNVF